jgi:hypothetical protein
MSENAYAVDRPFLHALATRLHSPDVHLRADAHNAAGCIDDRRLACGLLRAGTMELFISLLETLVSVAVAVELVGVGILIHRMLR